MPPTKNTTGHQREMFPVTIPSVDATEAPVRVRVMLAAPVDRAILAVATVRAHATAVDLEAQVIPVHSAA
jgi:hypothetical protein